MEITKREIIASIAIISFMLIIGLIISEKISGWQNDKNAEYQKALHISDTEMFRYGMQTNMGNAFVYGDLLAVDTVTYPEIGGEYMYVEKVKERYTKHTRRVKRGDSYRTETYYTWDRVESEDIKCKEVEFCGVVFDSSKINLPGTEYLDTIKESSRVRYKYYGVLTAYTGTIYTDMRENAITDNSAFYKDCTIDEALEKCTSSIGSIIFWIFWLALTAGLVYGFYYADNKWLEN